MDPAGALSQVPEQLEAVAPAVAPYVPAGHRKLMLASGQYDPSGHSVCGRE